MLLGCLVKFLTEEKILPRRGAAMPMEIQDFATDSLGGVLHWMWRAWLCLLFSLGESAILSVESRDYTSYCSWRNVSLLGVLWSTEEEIWVIYVLFLHIVHIYTLWIYYIQDMSLQYFIWLFSCLWFRISIGFCGYRRYRGSYEYFVLYIFYVFLQVSDGFWTHYIIHTLIII